MKTRTLVGASITDVMLITLLLAARVEQTGAADATPDHLRVAGGEPKWEYYEEPDRMGRGVSKGAHIDSLSTLSFQFPYEGPQLMRLVLQKSPKYGKVAYVKLERGQFLFIGEDPSITIRFDDGKPQKFRILEPSDGSRNAAVIKSYERLVTQLRKAKTMDVEAEFYLEGARVASFDVHGLKEDW